MDVYDLQARMGLNIDDYQRNLRRATSEGNEAANKLKDYLGKGAKIAGAAFTATSAAVVKATKDAVEQFAQYEQLIGGVETLFKDSADQVEKYADNAYKTAGLSANAYMETVTSFSASLLQGLEGDTSKAANVADLAIRDMSDNANKMGTMMESIQNAYQGFSKQNFTMLDNLKLGYGGTKTEMERLLADAEELQKKNGEIVEYSIDNYADIIEAIHVIQTEMGITGTTAKEAATTIEGSANAAKAAWQNLLTGFGRNDADLDKLVDEVTDSVITLGKNVLPVAERAFTSLMKTATREGAKLAKQIPGFIDDAAEHIHQTIADEFGATADQIFAVETAVKAAAAGFVAYKAAMVASDVVEGVITLTKVIQGATTAQEALNAAGMANPYVLLATAVATATVALKSYIDTQTDLLDEAGDTYNTLTDDQKAFLESSDELYKSINGNIKAADDEIKSVDKQVGALQSMTDELYKLNDAENLSNEQKDKMKMLVNSLNDAIPALNLELDKETGHLKNQKSTIDELIESYGKQAKAQAAQQRLVKLYEDQLEAEENLKRVEKERADARAKYDQLLWKSYQLQSQMRKEANSEDGSVERYNALADELAGVNAQLELQKNSLGDLNGAFVSASESVNSLNGSIKDTENIAAEAAGATDLLSESTTETTSAMTNQQRVAKALANDLKDYVVSVGGETYNISQSTLEDIQAISEEYSKALQAQEENIRGSLDLFSEFNGGAETSSQELINNLWNNAAELENWANNIQQLADWGINEGLLKELEEAGPASANKVQAMINMGEPKLKEYSEKWAETQGRIHEIAEKQTEDVKSSAENQIAAIIGVKNDNEEVVKKTYEDLGNLVVGGIGDNVADGTNKYVVPVTEEMVHQMNVAAQTALTEGDYPSKGENIDKGIAEGIERGEHWTTDAIHKLVHDIEQTYMEDTDSHSPSKLFKKLAGYIPQGMAEGIEDGKQEIVDAMGDVLNAVEDVLTDEKNKSRRGLIELEPKSRKGLIKLDPEKNKKGGDGLLLVLEPPKTDSGEDSGSGSRRRSRSYNSDYGGYGYSIERPLTINLVLKNGEAFARFVAPYLDLINAESVTLQQLGAAW